MKKLFSALCVMALASCATPAVESRVSVFHQFPASWASDDTFSIVPWRKELDGRLEFTNYAAQVAASLRQKGLNVVEPGVTAKYAVFLDFGIDDGRTVTESYAIPQWGVTGYSGSATTGTVMRTGNTATFSANTTATPTYGVTGYMPVTTSEQIYRRFLSIDIVEAASLDQGAPRKIYEGRLKSEGSCGTLANVIPAFLQALLGDFPGESGKGRTVKISMPNLDC